jgi:hypothetical protein
MQDATELFTTKRFILLLSRHGFLFFPVLVFVCLSIAGQVGQDYGVPNLFLDDGNPLSSATGADVVLRLLGSAIFETQVYAVGLLGLTWIAMLLMEDVSQRRADRTAEHTDTPFSFVPAVALLSLASFVSAELSLYLRRDSLHLELVTLILPPLGTLFGLILFCTLTSLALSLARALNVNRIYCVLGVTAGILALVVLTPITLPAKYLFIVVAWIVFGYVVVFLMPLAARLPALLLVFVVLMLANSFNPEKYTVPGMEKDYDSRRPLASGFVLANAPAQPRQIECTSKAAEIHPADNRLIDPVESLQHWYERRTKDTAIGTNSVGDATKPKLLIVATSGGAYRATFWTALVLESLLQKDKPGGKLQGVSESIKLMTGASGGMVASAYFVASREERSAAVSLIDQIEQDIQHAQRLSSTFHNPLLGKRDSLSSVVRQLVLFDMPGLFWPLHREHDRGRELESHWKTIADRSFSSLRAGEAAGFRPHIVLSPMLVETGQPLLISNLDLSEIIDNSKEAVAFFQIFPHAQSQFSLATAVRLNATFPGISPAVQLPTEPSVRAVDAGYYDNYGISVAIAYLEQQDVMHWIKQCTSGVMLIQIRAFKSDPDLKDDSSLASRLRSRFAWLTAPLEGALAARYSTNLFRNNQEIRLVQRLYENDFVRTAIFEPENEKDVTMTWNLSSAEFNQLKEDLQVGANKKAMQKLEEFWQQGISTPASAPTGSVTSVKPP